MNCPPAVVAGLGADLSVAGLGADLSAVVVGPGVDLSAVAAAVEPVVYWFAVVVAAWELQFGFDVQSGFPMALH